MANGDIFPAAQVGITALFEALEFRTDNEYHNTAAEYEPQPPRTWPSTFDYIDTQCGGFYGLTTVAAEKGTGKTLLAIATAIEAAATGKWQVVFFAAEDDIDGFRDRFNRYLEVHPDAVDCLPNFHYHSVGKGQNPRTLTTTVAMSVDTSLDIPILIVMDSINSIVNLGGEEYYLRRLGGFGLWAMLARRISGGCVSFFVISETNKRGEAKGEALTFWSDVYIKMKKKSDSVVDMWLDKTRRTPGEGPMGLYLRDWEEGRFIRKSFTPRLKAVGDDEIL